MPSIRIQVNGTYVNDGDDIPPGGHNRRSLTFLETHGNIIITADDEGSGGTFILVNAEYETSPKVYQVVPVDPPQYTITQRISDSGPEGTLINPADVHSGETYRILTLGNTDWNALADTTGVTYESYLSTVQAGSFRVGKEFKIVNVGTTTNWNAIGYSGTPAVGGTFTSTGLGSGDGTASFVDNNDMSVITIKGFPQTGTTGVVEAVSKQPVMHEVLQGPISVPAGPISYTPLGPNSVMISGKHIGGFSDDVTYVPVSDKLSSPVTVSKIKMYGIGSAEVPAGSEILLMKPDTSVQRFKLNVTVAYIPNPLKPVVGPFMWTFYHPVYPWQDGPRDFMDAYYPGGPSGPPGDTYADN